jgi:uncharacterized repeat protein (TIGR04042 family)
MPAMHFRVRWPDASETECYSPSSVVKDYVAEGNSYAVDDFMTRITEALHIASERVRQKFGFACSRAMDQLVELELAASGFDGQENAHVTVVGFSDAH